MNVSRTTLSMALVAVGAVWLAHADPWRAETSGAAFVSTRSAARRLFPQLDGAPQDGITVELAPAGGPRVELVPDPAGGHVVEVDGEVIGPADPHAVEGLFASLRIATTLRAVSTTPRHEDGARGSLTVTTPTSTSAVEVLGASPDRAGVYGTLTEVDGSSTWVIEQEISDLLELPAEAWLSRRLLPVQLADVVRVVMADRELRRGDDQVWRLRTPQGSAWLSTAAVEARLERVLSAPMRPWMPHARDRERWSPVLEIVTADGRSWTVRVGGPCAGDPQKVLVDRGGGWPGCISAAWIEPWPAAMSEALEPRLFPHDLARVLRIEQGAPEPMVLQRHRGDWRLVLPTGEERPAGDAEVSRWYSGLQALEVETASSFEPGAESLRWRVVTDAGVDYDLTCVQAETGSRCRRDDGPWLASRDGATPRSLSADRFQDRTLVALEPGEAIAVELFDREAEATLRQSAHLDLGVWRLDAPSHPDGDDALNELALEDLLATAGGLRALTWRPPPSGEPSRRIAIERRPRRGQGSTLELELFEGCVAAVEGKAGTIDEASCARLSASLLHPDPIAHWIETARRIELWRAGARVGQWSGDRRDNDAVPEALSPWAEVDDAVPKPGEPPGNAEVLGELRISPRDGGPAFTLRLGEHWAQLLGAPWHYRWSR